MLAAAKDSAMMKAQHGMAWFAALALGGLLAVAGPTPFGPGGTAAAQGFGRPGFQQPQSGQNPAGQYPAGQPAFNPSAAQSAPSMVGAWSSQHNTKFGPVQQTDAFSQDGRFVSVSVYQTIGLIARVWGVYRVSPAGPNQFRVELQFQGHLPQQLCTQAPGAQPSCNPFPIPGADATMVTFTSPNSYQSISATDPSSGTITATRDPNPVLLQQQVAPQQLVNLPALPPSPYAGPAVQAPRYSAPSSPVSRCSDTQARTSCAIAGGRLVVSDGCLVCLP